MPRIDTPELVHTDRQLIAVIPLVVPRYDIQRAIGAGLRELRGAIAGQGIRIIGPWFTHHFRRPADTFDFEICLPVSSELTATGNVKASEFPAATMARTVYCGSYDGLGAAWSELGAWIALKGHTAESDFWERYLEGPETTAEPADWQTELIRPLVD